MKPYYSPLNFDHQEKYDDKPRMDLMDLIPEACDHILEIGCGTGATGSVLKGKNPDLIYVGLEIDEQAARIAGTRLDKVLTIDIEKVPSEQWNFEKESFDLIIAADVLEHLYDPWRVMYLLRGFLKKERKGPAELSQYPKYQSDCQSGPRALDL